MKVLEFLQRYRKVDSTQTIAFRDDAGHKYFLEYNPNDNPMPSLVLRRNSGLEQMVVPDLHVDTDFEYVSKVIEGMNLPKALGLHAPSEDVYHRQYFLHRKLTRGEFSELIEALSSNSYKIESKGLASEIV